MSLFKKRVRKIIIPNYKNDIQKLEKTLRLVVNKLEKVEIELSELKGNRKQKFPIDISDSATTNRRLHFQWNDFQLLILLKNSNATNPEFAVSTEQLKISFNINKTPKTIRNKLLELVERGFVSSIGNKPKRFFILSSGLMFLEKQDRTMLRFK